MTQTIEALQLQQKKTNQAIGRLENEKRRAANLPLLGKTFRYRNCYSCPEKASDYWPLYAKVTEVDSAGYLKVFIFETDKYDNINIKVRDGAYHMSDYTPIKASEYNRALKSLKARVAKL